VEAGEASGYERRRVEQELKALDARRDSVRADRQRAAETLAGWISEAGPVGAAGELVPEVEPPLERYLEAAGSRADLLALSAREAASVHELEAAKRTWIPDITVGAGPKRVENAGVRDNGVVLSLSIPLPVFNRGDAAAAQARATADALRAERELKAAEVIARTRGAWTQARALRDAAQRFKGASLPGAQELSRIAETAWRGGEATLLELLDAYRSQLEADTTAIDLALRARNARIDADQLAGME
jgi:outer membrane protein, heavy metal efflux system